MNTPLIDKEIFSEFLPNEVMTYYQGDEKKLVRSYKNQNGKITLLIFERINEKGIAALLPNVLLNPIIHVAITRYKDKILIFMTEDRLIRFVFKEAQIPQKDCDADDNDEGLFEDDQPYAYTNGRWSPCPYCGSKNISTFMDGTAQCDDCKREFRYLQY